MDKTNVPDSFYYRTLRLNAELTKCLALMFPRIPAFNDRYVHLCAEIREYEEEFTDGMV